MKLDTKDFRYAGAKPLDLAKVSTTTPHYKSKKQYKEFLQADVAELV